MDSNKLSGASITFRVFDGGGLFRNTELGRESVDLKRIYDNTNHELYKQWRPLTLPERYNVDFRGFLKVTIVVLRGNEAPYAHTDDEEEEEGDEDNLSSMVCASLLFFKSAAVVCVVLTRCVVVPSVFL
jgi:hypothetical protein